MQQKPTKRRSAADQDKIIVAALRDAGRPVSAYELIEQVKGSGVTAPPTVYRALQRLIDEHDPFLDQSIALAAGIARRRRRRADAMAGKAQAAGRFLPALGGAFGHRAVRRADRAGQYRHAVGLSPRRHGAQRRRRLA